MRTTRGIVLLAVALLALAGCSSSPKASASDDSPRPILTGKVRYELSGSGVTSADITLQTPTGTSQQQGVSVPMTNKAGDVGLTFQFDYGDFVYFSAQAKDGSGSLTCRIVRVDDGLVISENTSSGEFSIATCEGKA